MSGNRSLRVAFVSYDWGEYSIRIASALTRQAEVCLLLPHQLAAPHLPRLSRDVEFHPFDKPRLRQPLRQLGRNHRNLQTIHRFRPDVLHLQHGHFWFNFALPLAKRYPLVVTIHDPKPHPGDRASRRTPQWIKRLAFHQADQIIVHADAMAQIVKEDLGIPEESLHVIPHIVLGDDRAQLHVQEDEHLLLFFGRIWAYKGLEYLVRAEPLITSQVPEAKIVIAGQGEDFGRYRSMMVHPEKFIVHNEYISDELRTELFRRASIVVLPYTEATQSGVIPLAYTFAKPVIATTVGGLPEMVDHGRTGLLVPPQDEHALASAIVSLLRDEPLRRQMGANGKRKIDLECSPESIAEQTLAVYERAIDRKPPAG